MAVVWTTFKRELAGYFATQVAYVFLVIFLAATSAAALFAGQLLQRGQADLRPLFSFLPWIFLVFIPALSMRLWAEERRSGTVEFLFTLPITIGQAVVAKFLAAWVFAGLALVLTTPLWMTVSYLGDPDHGVILAGYLGAWLMAGSYLALGAAMSAVTKSQVIGFVLAVSLAFVMTAMGSPVVAGVFGFLPAPWIEALGSLSLLAHFQAVGRGVIDLRDILYYLSVIAFFLFVNYVVLQWTKGR